MYYFRHQAVWETPLFVPFLRTLVFVVSKPLLSFFAAADWDSKALGFVLSRRPAVTTHRFQIGRPPLGDKAAVDHVGGQKGDAEPARQGRVVRTT